MAQGPHSSGNFNDWTVEVGKRAVNYKNLNGCYSSCVSFRLSETAILRVARQQKHNIKGLYVEIGKVAVKHENLNGCHSRCVTFRLFETIRIVATCNVFVTFLSRSNYSYSLVPMSSGPLLERRPRKCPRVTPGKGKQNDQFPKSPWMSLFLPWSDEGRKGSSDLSKLHVPGS